MFSKEAMIWQRLLSFSQQARRMRQKQDCEDRKLTACFVVTTFALIVAIIYLIVVLTSSEKK